MTATSIADLVSRVASRDAPRTEATLQADIRQLLLDPRLGLSDEVLLESQAGEGRRIDVEVGVPNAAICALYALHTPGGGCPGFWMAP